MYLLLLQRKFRLETFLILKQNTNGDLVMQEWTDFESTNLISEAKFRLEVGQIRNCLIIYSRLYGTSNEKLETYDVEEFLDILSNVSTDYLNSKLF